MVAEGRYNFSVKLLKSHVDANNHGVVSILRVVDCCLWNYIFC